MAKSKKALGRGISAILEDVEEAYRQDIEDKTDFIQELDIDKIIPNKYQPRKYFNENALKELAESIKKYGLLQPIIVVKIDNGYMLIAGERRLRASKLAGLRHIKAIIANIESEKLRELALIENIQRENLNPIELAEAYSELIEQYKITHDELSNIIHKSRTQITNTLRLLKLSDRTKELIKEGKISQGHAKILVGLDKKDEEKIVNTIIGQKLSVRETENLIKTLKNSKKNVSDTRKKISINELSNLSKKFKELGIKNRIKNNNIILEFKNNKEVVKILEKL